MAPQRTEHSQLLVRVQRSCNDARDERALSKSPGECIRKLDAVNGCEQVEYVPRRLRTMYREYRISVGTPSSHVLL